MEERILKQFQRRINATSMAFERYLPERIDWNEPLIMITGARGTGKTTMMLQYAKENHDNEVLERVLYVSLDDIAFESNRLILFAESFYEDGGRLLLVDEVHKYAGWSNELKVIHDSLPGLRVVVSGSSMLDVLAGEADLSRRAAVYHLPGLSFREHLKFRKGLDLPVLDLEDIVHSHHEISGQVTDVVDILSLFREYLKNGYYPFYKQGPSLYHSKLNAIVNQVLETDVPAVFNTDYQSIRSMKKLLYVIARSVPFVPNITTISRETGINRNAILKFLDVLDRAQLIFAARSNRGGMSYLTKPAKLFLDNTNLMYAIGQDKINPGHLRETFFLNQLKAHHDVTIPRFGDFMVNGEYVFEIGGPSKTAAQIAGVPQSYLALDGIIGGSGKRIPLWLFGFLY